MIVYPGVAISKGLEIGQVYQLYHPSLDFDQGYCNDIQTEWQRVTNAISFAKIQMEATYNKAFVTLDADAAAIFHAHQLILEDPELSSAIKNKIETEKFNAESAVFEISEGFCKKLEALDNEYLRARSADIRDVRNRILQILLNIPDHGSESLTTPSIIINRDLTPSDCMGMDKKLIIGICTIDGGTTSHVAILARSLGIPAVTGLPEEILKIETGSNIVLDGYKGQVVYGADEATLQTYRSFRDSKRKILTLAESEAQNLAITLDGHRVEVFANLGSGQHIDAENAIQKGAEGVGLLRSEFVFLQSTIMPDEDSQYKAYSTITDAFKQQPVILRTLDIGGDKQLPYMDLPNEVNPFLGVRGLRLCLRNVPLFKIQLRAALRAGYGHNLQLMFPMVTKVSEIRLAKQILNECRSELIKQGELVANNLRVGIMIEVPCAALMAHHFASEVDFFSIGTNDLAQYTLAADRTNTELAHLADALDPSVLNLIATVIEAAHSKGKLVGLCGELAGEPIAIPILLGLGLDEFSMNPPAIPIAKQIIRKLSFSEAHLLARQVLNFESPDEVREYVLKKVPFLVDKC